MTLTQPSLLITELSEGTSTQYSKEELQTLLNYAGNRGWMIAKVPTLVLKNMLNQREITGEMVAQLYEMANELEFSLMHEVYLGISQHELTSLKIAQAMKKQFKARINKLPPLPQRHPANSNGLRKALDQLLIALEHNPAIIREKAREAGLDPNLPLDWIKELLNLPPVPELK